MQSGTQEQTFLQLEKQYWRAMGSKDVDAAVALTKFPCLVAGPLGLRQVEENEYRAMMNSLSGEAFQDVEIENAKVRILNDQTAIVAYNVHMNGMSMLDVSTWVKDGDKWACAFHSENPLR